MKSIFIWKAGNPNCHSNESITVYHGSNWMLEEMPHEQISYEWIDCEVYDDITVYTIQSRPTNWTGEHFLEKTTMMYLKKKEDSNGIYEQIGEWCRYRPKQVMEWTSEIIQKECERIKNSPFYKG